MLHMYSIYLILKATVSQLPLILLQTKDIFTVHRGAGCGPHAGCWDKCPRCHLLYRHSVCRGLDATLWRAVCEDEGSI
jgi:hypothetical protein